jgi:hypothetical protein
VHFLSRTKSDAFKFNFPSTLVPISINVSFSLCCSLKKLTADYRAGRSSRPAVAFYQPPARHFIADQRRAGRAHGAAGRTRYRPGPHRKQAWKCASETRSSRPGGKGKRFVHVMSTFEAIYRHSPSGSTVIIAVLILVLLILIIVFKT